MDPIALGQPATYPSISLHAVSAPRAPASAPPADDLRADDAALQGSVGALGSYAAQFVAAPSAPASPTATTPQPYTTMPPLGSSSSSSPTAFTPARSWTSMIGQNGPGGAAAGSAADQGMSQILDAGDVFDTDG